MRLPTCLGLLASSLVLSSCLNEGSSLLSPSPSDGEASLAGAMSQMVIVSPQSGTTLTAVIGFDVVVVQEIREPIQGRAQLQYSKNETNWTDVGEAIPWSSRNREFSIDGVDLNTSGALTLRVIVYDVDPSRPLLESSYTSIVAMDHDVVDEYEID